MKPDTLDPEEFVVVPHVAAVDEFVMTNDDGSFVATINERFIDRLCARMNEREATTGDLAPLVIGHTVDGQPEDEGPPVIGFARNWRKDDFFETGKKAAYFDAWVYKGDVERAKKFPRRSCEVWTTRHECDPISFLGATTPARDLGLLKLKNDGSITYNCPGEMNMPADQKPKGDPAETGKAKESAGKEDQMLAFLQQILEKLDKIGAPAPSAGPAAADGKGGDEEMSQAELDQLLAELEKGGGAEEEDGKEDVSRKGEKPVQNSGFGSAGGDNTNVRLSRLETENEALRVQLARQQVKDGLRALYDSGRDVNPEDEALVADLIAMPPDMRVRQLDSIKKLSRPRLGVSSHLLETAIDGAVNGRPAGKRPTREDNDKIVKLARQKNTTYESAAAELGYTF